MVAADYKKNSLCLIQVASKNSAQDTDTDESLLAAEPSAGTVDSKSSENSLAPAHFGMIGVVNASARFLDLTDYRTVKNDSLSQMDNSVVVFSLSIEASDLP